MIVWGSNGNQITLGNLGERDCEVCEKKRDFFLTLTYRYGHLFWIPMFSWDTNYMMHCGICNYGAELDNKEVEGNLRANPKPWLHRLGWLIPVGAVIVLFIWGGL